MGDKRTLGDAINDLCEIDLAMWNNQEVLYEIRRMSVDDFQERYWDQSDGPKDIWVTIKKCCDLNVQRNVFIDEVDERIVEMIQESFKKV